MARLSIVIKALFVLLSGMVGAGESLAAASPWWQTEQGEVRLIASSAAAGHADEILFGLHFRMRPGWKIYWRSPGDAGFPPSPDWTGSENLGDARLLWPAPHRFTVLGLQTMGYKDEVVLPVLVAPFAPGQPIRLAARVRYLTCEEICVPYEAKLALELPAGPETSSLHGGLIEQFLRRVPGNGEGTGLQIMRVTVEGSPPAQALRLSIVAHAPLDAPDIFVEGPKGVGFSAPEVRFGSDRRSALMRIAVSTPKSRPIDLAGGSIGLTLVDGDRALERSVTATAEVSRSLMVVLALALLGGLILNLMPCVLPVLSIKLLSVVGHGGADPRRVRIGFLASAGGILASFLVLASGAVALKSAGIAAAWGIQFQQPLFLAAMVAILTLFACNLWGLFEIRLPGNLADAAARTGGGHGIGGQFMTGAFATVLATPCSAPFLGTAIGFALARGAVEIYLVFIALGVGLALPYLIIAAAPRLATRLPRPGPWMITLRRILGVALAATAVWLLSVLAVQTGFAGAGLIALLMVAIAVALRQARHLAGRAHLASWLVVVAMTALALGAAGSLANQEGARRTVLDAGNWQPFKLAAIADEVAKGRVVFVDVTADWCLTCKVNKALVLDRGEVSERLASPAVTAMKADWTKPDSRISAYLAGFGRYGIPFDAVYGPGAPAGILLPELLTKDSVLEAIARAAGSATAAATAN